MRASVILVNVSRLSDGKKTAAEDGCETQPDKSTYQMQHGTKRNMLTCRQNPEIKSAVSPIDDLI